MPRDKASPKDRLKYPRTTNCALEQKRKEMIDVAATS